MERWDVIVLGQGIAGTTLAWHLRWLGKRVLVIDREEAVTSSKIAAGLITPITGRRVSESWRVTEFLPMARVFYDKFRAETGQVVFHDRRAVRLFTEQEELQRYRHKEPSPEIKRHLSDPQPSPLVNAAHFRANFGGFEMVTAQLNVLHYLETSREYFRRDGGYRVMEFQADQLEMTPSGIQIHGDAKLQAGGLVFCQGYAGAGSKFFPWIRFKAARGDILTVAVPDLNESRCIHGSAWLAPVANGLYHAGATYDWHLLRNEPTAHGRQEVVRKLARFLKLPFEIRDHRAAVRPIISESKGLLGRHPVHPQLAYFNGLGSKGSLHAPLLAKQLAEHLVLGKDLDDEVDLRANR